MICFIIGIIVGLYIGIIPVTRMVNNMDRDKRKGAADACEGYHKNIPYKSSVLKNKVL